MSRFHVKTTKKKTRRILNFSTQWRKTWVLGAKFLIQSVDSHIFFFIRLIGKKCKSTFLVKIKKNRCIENNYLPNRRLLKCLIWETFSKFSPASVIIPLAAILFTRCTSKTLFGFCIFDCWRCGVLLGLGKFLWIPLVSRKINPIRMYKMTKIHMGKMKNTNDESSCTG